MKRRYKVLRDSSLTDVVKIDGKLYWFFMDEIEDEVDTEEIEPIFNRNGIYYDRKKKFAWQEKNGFAFLYNVEMFKWKLYLEQAKIFRETELKAIRTLIINNVCPKSLENLYDQYLCWFDHRQILRDWKGRLK